MDQTKFFQLRTALCILVCDNKMVDTTMKPKDIHNWYHCIMKVALRLKASNNSNITWMECENNTFPIKESPCPRVAHVQPWRQITKSPYTNNTTRSNLTFNCVTVDFWEWISNLIPHFTIDIITYPHRTTTQIDQTLPIWIQSGTFYLHGLTVIPAWISNHMPSKVLVEITYPIPKLQRCNCLSLGMYK